NRKANLFLSYRINLVVLGTKLFAFYSNDGIVPEKAFWSILSNKILLKPLSLWLNSTFFMIQVLLNRNETDDAYCEPTKEEIKTMKLTMSNTWVELSDQLEMEIEE